jgi:photosystem II stability/assembly factor-like uncharacterized protein
MVLYMKRIFIILILLILTNSMKLYSQQYWLKYSKASNQNLWKCSFVDTLNGWAIGDSGVIVHTSNGGLNWVEQNSKIKEYMVAVSFYNKKIGWALGWGLYENFYGTYILRTTDGGINWDTSRYPVLDTYIRTIHFLDSLNGYMGGGPGLLLKTTNGGINWYNCDKDTTSVVSKFPVNRFRFYSNGFGIACGGIMDIAGVIWRTTNSGLYWNVFPIAPEPINDIKFFDNNNIIALAGDYEYGSSILRTTNAGLNWSYKNMGIFGVPNVLSFRTESEAWAPMGYLEKFLITTDAGNYWNLIDTPDSTRIFDLVFINSKFGVGVGLNGAVVRFNASSANIINNTTSVYLPYLYQNYPNPFNPKTTIQYSIPEISNVDLSIYNLLGKKVSTLFKGFKNAGWYTDNFFSSNFPSGVYYYRLSVKGLKTGKASTQTKKMILIK